MYKLEHIPLPDLEVKPIEELHESATYFPPLNGRYEVKAGLKVHPSCFGNGKLDRQIFQIDENFPIYRQAKLQSRKERLDKYYQTHNYSDAVASVVAGLMIKNFTLEYPQYFYIRQINHDNFALHCQLTGEILYLNQDYQLQQVEGKSDISNPEPNYVSSLDALASQVQEDFTVISQMDNTNWISAIHVCLPSHWSAEEKIGKNFATIHAPVIGMEKINLRENAIVKTMITQPPMVRFVWELSTDTRLNHHPDSLPAKEFNIHHPQLYLRIERHVICGFPQQEAALTVVRTYFRDLVKMKKNAILHKSRSASLEISQLISALDSMSDASIKYKRLANSYSHILDWLKDSTYIID
jgi:dimethylamine monooxygenase subunit A